MADFLIAAFDETKWQMVPAELERQVRAGWPQAEVWLGEARVSFTIPLEDDYAINGGLDRGAGAVALDAGLADSARFAAWYREQVPPEQELHFFDEGATFTIALEPGVSAADIVRRAEAQWRS